MLMNSSDLIIKKANKLFQERKFKEAQHLYKQATQSYGSELLSLNIELCKENIDGVNPKINRKDDRFSSTNLKDSYIASLEQQLDQTQRLAERYFKQCQLQKIKSKGF